MSRRGRWRDAGDLWTSGLVQARGHVHGTKSHAGGDVRGYMATWTCGRRTAKGLCARERPCDVQACALVWA